MSKVELAPALRYEVAIVTASTGVKEGSVEIKVESTDDSVHLTFVLETEIPVEEPVADIRSEEIILFRYKNIDAVGVCAPLVISGREDFPRNLGHLNPVRPDSPVSLCLARAGLQPIYDRYGLEGILHRLRTWLRDAQTGGLMADGWEPVPYSEDMSVRGGILSAAAFQEIAARHGVGVGYASGLAKITLPEMGDFVLLYPNELSASEPAHDSELARACKSEKDGGQRVGAPWVFVWSDRDVPLTDPIFGLWRNYKDMRDALDPIGLTECLEGAVGQVFANSCDCIHSPARKTLVVLIGIWRPESLAENIFGLSDEAVARHLEIKAYTLESTMHENPIQDQAELKAIIADPWPNAELYRWTTDTAYSECATFIGYGSLGSALVGFLVRSGVEDIRVIDPDSIFPHNIARHTADQSDLYTSKVKQFLRTTDAILGADSGVRGSSLKESVLDLSYDELAEKLGDSKLVIDATADEQVRGYLSEFSKSEGRQVIRVEIYNKGRLGVLFVTDYSSNPNLLELYYMMCLEALVDDNVHQWLFDEHVDGFDDEELIFGFGCTSRTTRLPNYVVAQHASAFMPKFMDGIKGELSAGIGINSLDEERYPIGWRWIDVQKFHRFNPDEAAEWTVSVHKDVLEFLEGERDAASSDETGGYLYGGLDFASKQIIIVLASPLPPNSIATSTSLKLGPAGMTEVERRIRLRTRGRLGLCGTWHSHPQQSSAMSATDVATITGFASTDSEHGIPTLLMIAGNDGVNVYLYV